MAQDSRRRNILIAIVVIIIAILLSLLRCLPQKPAETARNTGATPPTPTGPAEPAASTTGQPGAQDVAEVLTPATLTVPERVMAGAAFAVAWTGPDNRGDYVTIVRREAPADASGAYQETQHGKSLELTAPIEPGGYEVRYLTGRSRTVLGRAPVEVEPTRATVDAAAEVVLGAPLSVTWTGPNNKGDFVTIVPKDAPDAHYGSYTDADKPSPQTLTAPTVAGDAELRYVTGQGKRVLARRPIRIVMPDISLSAPADAIAGSTIQVTWTGPNNTGDYITVVAAEIPDGQYGNYTVTSSGSPLNLLVPILEGGAELRYMTGQGNQVLARRPIKIVAADVTLSAPPECAPGATVTITWTGPNNSGDYITMVAKGTPDSQYAAYTYTSRGSPLMVAAPKEAGDAEIRYVAGQGNKVLARIPIKIVP